MISKEQAEKELAEFGATLRECVVYGWDQWQELGNQAASLRAVLSARTRACFISDHILTKVRKEFSERRGARLHERRGFLELVLNSKYVVRFKKLDDKGRSRNILTKQQRLWFQGQLDLPHMPVEAKRLVAGYVLDMLGTDLRHVLVTCPCGTSGVEWMIALPQEGNVKIVEMPRVTKKPAPPSVRSRKRRESDEEA